MKKLLLLPIFCSTLLLNSCGGEETQDISFDGFTLSITQNFNEIDGHSVENKQITNKIIKAYYKREGEGFKDNLIITRTNNDNNLSNKEYADTNIDKLQSDLVGFNFIEKDDISIKCGKDKITLYYIGYSVFDDIFGDGLDKYYVLQYYYTFSTYGYIISFASNDEKKLKDFQKYGKSLKCK